MTESKESNCKYIVFTGVPGSGKSSAIRSLIKELQEQGHTAIFHDDAVRKYRQTHSRLRSYLDPFLYIKPVLLLKILWFWIAYPAPKDSDYRFFSVRFLRKKLVMCKRTVYIHVLVNKEKPDYFIDETIQLEYRILDIDNLNVKMHHWALCPGNELFLVVVTTPLEIAIDRVVEREAVNSKMMSSLKTEWDENRSWLKKMASKIVLLTDYIKSQNSILDKIRVRVIEIDGRSLIQENTEYIMQSLSKVYVSSKYESE